VPRISPNSLSGHIAIQYGLRGPNMVISTACASGAHGIGQAYRMIRHGEVEVAVTGGAEASLSEFTFGAYCALRVLSRRNDSPREASRPFDRDRDGFVMGEGAAVLILEALSHAVKRGGHIYAEVIGYGANSGATHMVMPKKDGSDAAAAMDLALRDGKVSPGEVDYINAHGTSTTLNDKAETLAIKTLFKERAYKIPVSSTKSMIGHTIGASGAIEALVCALVIENNIIPPTINYTHPDPDCDLDYVPNSAREKKVELALSNSFGFGNTNACLLFRRYH
jgi:3-oxoacyl-[acyl-carrier-protein] synthase II